MGNKQPHRPREQAEVQEDSDHLKTLDECAENSNTDKAVIKAMGEDGAKEAPKENMSEKKEQDELNTKEDSESDKLPMGSMGSSCPSPEPVFFNLILYCTSSQRKSRNEYIVLKKPPRNIYDIKLHVQNELSIPTCCQVLSYESRQLNDHYLLDELRIREGDTLTIHYTSEAMVDEVTDVISSIRHMDDFLSGEVTQVRSFTDPHSSELDMKMFKNLNSLKVEELAITYFHPSSNPKCQANRLFFVRNDGLQEMHRLHEELLKRPWVDCHVNMQLVEHAILRVLWNISAAFSLRMLLFQRPTMEAVIKSLVRVKIPADRNIMGPHGSFESTRITCEMLYKAVGTICNLAELPECRLEIASRKDVLDQLLAMLTCPSYTYIASLVSSAGLLCLSYSPETHQYLITDNVIQKMEKACKSYKYQTPMDEQLLKYFRSMFYAQLLYGTASNTPLTLKSTMHLAIKEFLKSADYSKIWEHERKNGYIWSTVAPFVKLVYFPKGSSSWTFCGHGYSADVNKEMLELENLCIEAGVFSLQNMMLCDDTRGLLIAENLLDFVVCMPWHLKEGEKSHERACDLNKSLGQKMQVHPPSLVNIAKAKLAVAYFGLEKVINASSVHELVNEVMY